MTRSRLILLCAAAAFMSACGGGGGGDESSPAATEQVPASASASVDGWVSYLKLLVVAAADGIEPVDVSAVTPQAGDTIEPAVVE